MDTGKNPAAFAGRDKTVAHLTGLMDRAIEGKGRLVFISGEAGVGKSRIVGKLIGHAEQNGVIVLQGKCLYREGADPYLPFLDALRSYSRKRPAAERAASDSTEAVPIGLMGMEEQGAQEQRSDGVSGETELLGRLRQMDIKKERARMYETVSSYIIAMSEKDPLLIIIDDLHWADSGTLQLLVHVAEHIRGSRVLIAAAYRPEELVGIGGKPHALSGISQSLVREGVAELLSIPPLCRGETRQLISLMLGTESLATGLDGIIYRATEGNPFFIEEMLKNLVERGVLDPAGSSWTGDAEDATRNLPSSVKAVLLDRVSRLDPVQAKTLENAAIIGQEFTFPVLKALSDMSEEALVDVLDALIKSKLLSEETDAGQERYRFTQSLLREALYEGLSRTRRRLLHKKVAAAIESLSGNKQDEAVYQLAYQYASAGEDEKSAVYLVKAGTKALKAFALEDARRYFTSALEALGKLDRKPENRALEEESLLSLGDVNFYIGELDKAIVAYKKVLKLTEETPNDRIGAHAFLQLGRIHELRGHWADAMSNLETALAMFRKMGDAGGQIRAVLAIGMVHFRKADYPKALELYMESGFLVEATKDVGLKGMWTMNTALIYSEMGAHDKAEKYFLDARKYAEQAGDHHELARAYNNLGDLRMRQWRYAEAVPLFEKCIEACDKSGQLRITGYAMSNLGESLVYTGEPEKARVYLARALAIFEKIDEKLMVSRMKMIDGVIYRMKKEWEPAKQCGVDSLVMAEPLGVPLAVGEYSLELGVTCRMHGDKEEARGYLTKAAAVFKEINAQKFLERAQEELKLVGTGR